MKPTLTKSRHDRGFALFTALMFLIVLTVLAVTVLRSSTVNERLAGNDLDRARAYQAAEAALRDAQQDLLRIRADGTQCGTNADCRAFDDLPNADSGLTNVAYGCNSGLCSYTSAEYASATFTPPWKSANAADVGVTYGTRTGAPAIENVYAQPIYWIEVLFNTIRSAPYYRITVIATGTNPNTRVQLQEIYEP